MRALAAALLVAALQTASSNPKHPGDTKTDYYKLLKLKKGFSEKELKTAYRNAAKKYHPDKNQGEGQAAAAETFTVQRRWRRDDPDGYSPGELGFDPLGMYGDAPAKRKSMRAAELANGRLAMVAVLGYVLLEAGSHQPVAGLTPALFAPPWETAAALFAGAAN